MCGSGGGMCCWTGEVNNKYTQCFTIYRQNLGLHCFFLFLISEKRRKGEVQKKFLLMMLENTLNKMRWVLASNLIYPASLFSPVLNCEIIYSNMGNHKAWQHKALLRFEIELPMCKHSFHQLLALWLWAKYSTPLTSVTSNKNWDDQQCHFCFKN